MRTPVQLMSNFRGSAIIMQSSEYFNFGSRQPGASRMKKQFQIRDVDLPRLTSHNWTIAAKHRVESIHPLQKWQSWVRPHSFTSSIAPATTRLRGVRWPARRIATMILGKACTGPVRAWFSSNQMASPRSSHISDSQARLPFGTKMVQSRTILLTGTSVCFAIWQSGVLLWSVIISVFYQAQSLARQ